MQATHSSSRHRAAVGTARPGEKGTDPREGAPLVDSCKRRNEVQLLPNGPVGSRPDSTCALPTIVFDSIEDPSDTSSNTFGSANRATTRDVIDRSSRRAGPVLLVLRSGHDRQSEKPALISYREGEIPRSGSRTGLHSLHSFRMTSMKPWRYS